MRISNHDEQTLGSGHGHIETLGTRHEAQALQSVRNMLNVTKSDNSSSLHKISRLQRKNL
jgi:hypothetical protein